MTPQECMRVLGLGASASVGEVKRAYRALAQRLHPDKRRGDESARQQFIEISTAYRTMMRVGRALDEGKRVGACRECGEFGEVIIGPDGQGRCSRCVFRPGGGRLLPLPMLVVARCTGTILLLGLAYYLLILGMRTGRMVHAAGALAAGLVGLALLAHTCLTVRYCLHPREKPLQASRRRARR
jgi:hypothetical protein